MSSPMSLSARTLSLPAVLLLTSCLSGPVRWPGWATDLRSKLSCGMQIEQIRGLTDKEVGPVAGGHPWTGDYRLSHGRFELALMLDNSGGLESIALSQKRMMLPATRLSPRRNLCTGEVIFLLRIGWTVTLSEFMESADVYLDGRRLESKTLDKSLFEVPEGKHDLLFFKDGVGLIRHLDLGPDDRGEQRLDLTDDELRTLKAPRQRSE